jgi:hypothetical protein
VQVDNADPVSKLKEAAELISGIPAAEQALILSGERFDNATTIADTKLSDGDVVLVVSKDSAAARAQAPAANNNRQDATKLAPDGSAMYPEQFIQAVNGNTNALAQLRGMSPDVAKAVEDGNVQELQFSLRQVSIIRHLCARACSLPRSRPCYW